LTIEPTAIANAAKMQSINVIYPLLQTDYDVSVL